MGDVEAAAGETPPLRGRTASRSPSPAARSLGRALSGVAHAGDLGSHGLESKRRLMRQATGLQVNNRKTRAAAQPTWVSRQPNVDVFEAEEGWDEAVDDSKKDESEDDDRVNSAGSWAKRRPAAGGGGGMESLGAIPSVSCYEESWELMRMLVIAAIIAAPGLCIGLLLGPAQDGCISVEGVCLWMWGAFAGAAVVALALLRLTVKMLARICTLSRYVNSNHAFTFLRLHKRFAQVLWATFLFLYWKYLISPYINTAVGNSTKEAIRKLLGCYLAYAVLWLVKDIIVLEIAHQYLWEPYFERVQDSILSQYLLLLLNDFALHRRCDREDHQFALAMAERAESGAKMSLFAIAKAVSFVPNKLQMYTDDSGKGRSIDSAKAARMYGRQLFDSLFVASVRASASNAPATAPATAAGGEAARGRSLFRDDGIPKEPANIDSARPAVTSGQQLPPVAEQHPVHAGVAPRGSGYGAASGGMFSPFMPLLKGLGIGGQEASQAFHPSEQELAAAVAVARDGAAGSGGGGGSRSRGNSTGSALADRGPLLTLQMLRPAMCRKLAKRLFEFLSPEGSPLTAFYRDDFAEGVASIYRQRKSLSLTLADYESIVHKLGRVIAIALGFAFFFVALWIWTTEPLQMGVSLISLVVAFSFIFGSSAADFCDSCIFVFVTRAYDVGDRVLFMDDSNTEQSYMVAQINMLGTVFKRWDEQFVWFANKKLALKEIRNLKRSGPGIHRVLLEVPFSTSAETLQALTTGLVQFAESGGSGSPHFSVKPETVAIGRKSFPGGNKLGVVLTFQQRSNFQDGNVSGHNYDAMMTETARLCDGLELEITMPVQPVIDISKGGGASGRQRGGGGGGSGSGSGGGTAEPPALA